MPEARCFMGKTIYLRKPWEMTPTIANGERAHTHTKSKESMRQFQLKFYPHQLKNLPRES